MPRRDIGFGAGEHYHLYNRGVDRGAVFFSEDNYRYFERLLEQKAVRNALQIIAYCLMPNHFHLLVRAERDNAMAGLMIGVCGSYAQALNRQRGRTGALFQGRLRSAHVDRDPYLAQVARYIHLNPVAAGFVVRPQDWPYSNYTSVSEDGVLVGGIFANVEAYRHFVEAPMAMELPGSLKLPGS